MEKDFRHLVFFWGKDMFKNSREWVFSPPTNVYETSKDFIILMEIPGVSKDDVKVEVHGNSILVRGLRKDPVCSGDAVFHNMEIHFGRFEKVIQISAGFDNDKVKVTYTNGFLKIVIPKKSKRVVEIDIEE
ncbi:MAG: Hsp20/alpha crystallin family protein [candidate division WOR-3 bacterium]